MQLKRLRTFLCLLPRQPIEVHGCTTSYLHYIQGSHQQYMADRFSLSVASLISLCACPSHDSGSDGWLRTPTSVPLRRPSMVASASLAASFA